MRKHLIIGLIIGLIIWLFIVAVAGALMASDRINAAPPMQTASRTYNNQITTAFLARELGIPEPSILNITIGSRGEGCSVDLASPIMVHQDEHTGLDRQVTITVRPQNELSRSQQSRLDEIMETQGCFRSRTE